MVLILVVIFVKTRIDKISLMLTIRQMHFYEREARFDFNKLL